MKRTLLRVIIAAALVGLGWSAGRAQTPEPDFELVVDAPAGATTITCKRGCSLAWVERGLPDAAGRQQKFWFECGGPGVGRCSSRTVGGWLVR
jgi:hypothetical protein